MGWSVSGWRQRNFVNTVLNTCFQKLVAGIFWLQEKISILSSMLWITQFINTCKDPVFTDHLILCYCSCNTYLLHRRAELKAAPSSTWLMWNWTLGNNEPLTVPTLYIWCHIVCCLKLTKQLTFVWSGRLFCITNIMYECFYRIHHQSVIV